MPHGSVFLTALLLDNPRCRPCIVKRSSMSAKAVEATLAVVKRVLSIYRTYSVCGSCGASDTLHFLKRPEHWNAAR